MPHNYQREQNRPFWVATAMPTIFDSLVLPTLHGLRGGNIQMLQERPISSKLNRTQNQTQDDCLATHAVRRCPSTAPHRTARATYLTKARLHQQACGAHWHPIIGLGHLAVGAIPTEPYAVQQVAGFEHRNLGLGSIKEQNICFITFNKTNTTTANTTWHLIRDEDWVLEVDCRKPQLPTSCRLDMPRVAHAYLPKYLAIGPAH